MTRVRVLQEEFNGEPMYRIETRSWWCPFWTLLTFKRGREAAIRLAHEELHPVSNVVFEA